MVSHHFLSNPVRDAHCAFFKDRKKSQACVFSLLYATRHERIYGVPELAVGNPY
jgi:hypothetical protein